jgi:hypothetical protein
MKKRSPQMKEVVKLVDELKPIFFLHGWQIDIGVHKEPKHDNPNTAAEMAPKNCYRTAALEVYPRFFEEDAESRRDIIVHELCHIITGIQNGIINTARNATQVSDAEASYAQEEETSWMASIICKLL